VDASPARPKLSPLDEVRSEEALADAFAVDDGIDLFGHQHGA
jgi:hypothetical protein